MAFFVMMTFIVKYTLACVTELGIMAAVPN